MTPVRIQLKRTKGWKMPENTVKVDRSTKWGNPYVVGMWRNLTAADAVEQFRQHAPSRFTAELLAELRGKNLACWCALPRPGEPDICHAAVLLYLANSDTKE